jgi:hypothetical protein
LINIGGTMTFKELRDLLNHYDTLQGKNYRPYDDCEVAIVLNRPSIGSHATVSVKSIFPGIDWDHNKILVYTEKPVDLN